MQFFLFYYQSAAFFSLNHEFGPFGPYRAQPANSSRNPVSSPHATLLDSPKARTILVTQSSASPPHPHQPSAAAVANPESGGAAIRSRLLKSRLWYVLSAFAFPPTPGCCSHAQLYPALHRASLAAYRIQRRHVGIVGTQLYICDVLRGILHASFFAVVARLFHVANVLHALEYVQ
jgi:hypothetical protein